MTEVALRGVVSLILMIATQLVKEFWPEKTTEYKKYIALGVVLVATLLSLLYFAANNFPLVVPNYYTGALIILQEIGKGLLIGLSAVGLYEVSNNAPIVSSAVRSTDEILGAKTSVDVVANITAPAKVIKPIGTITQVEPLTVVFEKPAKVKKIKNLV